MMRPSQKKRLRPGNIRYRRIRRTFVVAIGVQVVAVVDADDVGIGAAMGGLTLLLSVVTMVVMIVLWL